jgi:leucyl aminopeptidase (aminopeptidase T)
VKLKDAAALTLNKSMNIKKDEQILIVTDTPLYELGKHFFDAARDFGAETLQINFLPRNNNGEEPPEAVAAAMKKADVVLLITSRSLSHTQARKQANLAGARIASMPGLSSEMMQRTLAIDYTIMQDDCNYLANILESGEKVHLTTESGTDISFSIKGRIAQVDGGIYDQPGDFGNLPAGEVYIAPLEGTAEGKIIIDGSMAGIGLLDKPIILEVKKGLVINVSGGKAAAQLQAILDKYGEKSRNIAELGIGTHPEAQLTGAILEDEKIAGTVHIALGDNSTFGGTVEVASHLDGVILKPTLKIDDKTIIDNGILKYD